MSKTNNLSSQISQGNPETWITAAEASSILHLSLRTVISRASSGKLPARIPNDAPFTCDGMQNYLIHLEALPQKAQLEYLRNHLPPSQSCGLDLTTPRSSNGDVWLYQFLDVARIIQDAANIRNMYQHTGKVVSKLRDLAEIHGISLSTLYRLCRKSSAKAASARALQSSFFYRRRESDPPRSGRASDGAERGFAAGLQCGDRFISAAELGRTPPKEGALRVAAYIRVSNDSEDQENSYEMQSWYFASLLQRNPDWTSAGVYSDCGLSGTNKEHRTGYKEMRPDSGATGDRGS